MATTGNRAILAARVAGEALHKANHPMRSPYELFLRIAECGSISKACTILNITQPALSRQLQKLEHDLGAALFERTAGGVRLTSFGESLVPHAQAIVRAQKAAALDISRLKRSLKGHITFGVSVPSNLLPLATIDALAKHPDLRLTIVEKPPRVLIDMVRRKELEFALCTAALIDSDDASLASRRLFVDRRLVVAAADHPYFSRDSADLASLLHDLWILPPAGFVTEWLAGAFAEAGLTAPLAKIETTSTIQMLNAIETQRFISVLPATAVRRQLDQGLIRPIAPERLSKVVDILAVYRSGGHMSRAADHLLDCIAAGEETSNVIHLGDFRARKGVN
jgi:DNA-binding transcriptional LysR family regulator